MIIPFCMTEDEVGARGGAPASDLRLRPGPELARLEDREPEGVRRTRTSSTRSASTSGARTTLRRRSRSSGARSPAARSAVLKLDLGVSGLGNALLDLDAASRDLRAAIELEDEEIDVEQYLALLDEQGGIVEERSRERTSAVPASSYG